MYTPRHRTGETRRGQRGRVLTLLLSYCSCIHNIYIYTEQEDLERYEKPTKPLKVNSTHALILPPPKGTISIRILWGCYLHLDPINHSKLVRNSRHTRARKQDARFYPADRSTTISCRSIIHTHPARTYIKYIMYVDLNN